MTGCGTPPGHRAAAPNALPKRRCHQNRTELAADPLAVGRPRPLPLKSTLEPHQMCDVAPSLAVCGSASCSTRCLPGGVLKIVKERVRPLVNVILDNLAAHHLHPPGLVAGRIV